MDVGTCVGGCRFFSSSVLEWRWSVVSCLKCECVYLCVCVFVCVCVCECVCVNVGLNVRRGVGVNVGVNVGFGRGCKYSCPFIEYVPMCKWAAPLIFPV